MLLHSFNPSPFHWIFIFFNRESLSPCACTMTWAKRNDRVCGQWILQGMGASLSSLGTNGSTIGPGLGDIPESCVARVFLHLTPPEICNLARLNLAFRGAASADSVWESKLPPNYHDLLDLMPPERYRNLSKKDIFALLSRPVLFDDGYKVRVLRLSFQLSSCRWLWLG